MLRIRRSAERCHANHGWLDSYHSFSFADYHDPAHMGFRALRVINEDVIAPGKGFGTHPHRDMEILTYVLEGRLAHRDSMDNGEVVKAGEVQGMSAGTGVTHSEFNASHEKPLHLLQMWVVPHTRGVTPAYGEWRPQAGAEGWQLAASGDGAPSGIRLQADVRFYIGLWPQAGEATLPVSPGRYGWLQVASGSAEVDGRTLYAGDGVSFSGVATPALRVLEPSRFVLFDLA